MVTKAKDEKTTNAVSDMVAPKRKTKKNPKIVISKKKATKKKAKKKTAKKKVVKKKVTENNQKSKKKTAKKKSKKKTGGSSTGTNGGKRAGSGRKKGAATTKTREIADKLAESNEITPLEYMLGVLRETPAKLKAKYEAGEIDSEEYIVELQAMQKRKDNAAEKAAPYIHPRLSSIEAKVNDGAHERWLALMEDEDE